MLKNEETKVYYYSKLLQSYLYNDEIYKNINQGCFDAYVFDLYFIALLIDYVETYTSLDSPYRDLTIKTRLYNLINHIRMDAKYSNMEIKKYYYDIFNDLIIKLNQTDEETNIEEWILTELVVRTEIKLKRIISYDKYYEYEDFVKRSLGYDFIFLTYLSDEINDDMFNESIELLANDEFYFASLNDLLLNCPILLSNATFTKRTKKVLEYNLNHIDNSNPLKIRTFIKKQINKHIKNLKNI